MTWTQTVRQLSIDIDPGPLHNIGELLRPIGQLLRATHAAGWTHTTEHLRDGLGEHHWTREGLRVSLMEWDRDRDGTTVGWVLSLDRQRGRGRDPLIEWALINNLSQLLALLAAYGIEPDGPGLRVLANDDPVFAERAYAQQQWDGAR